MLHRLVTDFPEPDSPTKARVSPSCIDKFTECSTRFLCVPSPKESDRFLICKMGFLMALYFNLDGIVVLFYNFFNIIFEVGGSVVFVFLNFMS